MRWIIGERDADAEARLRKELGVPSLVAAVLVQRGYREPEEADRFLNPSLSHLHDPRELPDYAAARDAILGARERKERIYVHGDYDVDGVTSSAIFGRFLKAAGCDVHVHVPHRMKEGYGIHLNAVKEAQELGTNLFLTCDCGGTAHVQVDAAREAGMTVVVTDHHTLDEALPNAHAVVNPHRDDSRYPFDELSGAGVAFKLCEGLCRELELPVGKFYDHYLDLAALGTIADVMPLTGENRIIAKFGLKALAQTRKAGLQALMEVAGVDPSKGVTAYHVGFLLGPRLNAAGRIDDAALASRLLLTKDMEEARALATEIDAINLDRRMRQEMIVQQAVTMVESSGAAEQNVIMVASEEWHSGIVGIVAGKLVERFNRPAFVMTVNTKTGMCKGSGRSIKTFDLASTIRAFPDLVSGGGHAAAAGCAFPYDRLEDVRKAFHDFASNVLTPEDLEPTMAIDLEVDSAEVTSAAADALDLLAPFGCGNPKPNFLVRGMRVTQLKPTKNPQHVKVTFRTPQAGNFPAIAFGMGDRFGASGVDVVTDVVFQPEINEWQGHRSLQLKVSDYALSEPAVL
ncbi:single-stranded-DNA-specific exonuclease RecJ [bacterium]|nr:MAG: single-stranded-DNA-specific exonuclease RecJ [bacterium]